MCCLSAEAGSCNASRTLQAVCSCQTGCKYTQALEYKTGCDFGIVVVVHHPNTIKDPQNFVHHHNQSPILSMLTSRPLTNTATFACKRVAASGGPQGIIHAQPALLLVQQTWSPARQFSSSSSTRLREFFPQKESEKIKTTKPAWPHPV